MEAAERQGMDRATESQGGSSKCKDPTCWRNRERPQGLSVPSKDKISRRRAREAGLRQALGALQAMGEGLVFIFRTLGSLQTELNKREI